MVPAANYPWDTGTQLATPPSPVTCPPHCCGESVVQTVLTNADRLVDSLEDVRRTPLESLPAELVDEIVSNVLENDSAPAAIEVAAFSSSI